MYSYRTDYAQWVLHPEQTCDGAHACSLAGERSASHGHVVLLRQLTKLVGLHDPELMGGLDKARRLEAAGKPFVMMTLTNDDVLLREMATEQKNFQRNAAAAEHRLQHRGPKNSKTSQLSRWATLFTADVGFAADGRAYLYETLLQPSWFKERSRFPVDRGGRPREARHLLESNAGDGTNDVTPRSR